MRTIIPSEEKTATIHSLLLGAVAPRPIAFASTIDEDGRPNLSPFSFFNCFSAKPPILVFSPARRGRDNTTKHTYENVLRVPEVVINVVSHAMVHQASLASTEYPEGVNEFIKAGFTQLPSEVVKPFRVKESPVQMECRVNQVIALGTEGGAGNLVICEVLRMHIDEGIFGADGKIDPHKIDLVARMGGDYYCRASGESVFLLPKPLTSIGVGVDVLPEAIRNSRILTGNNLGQLGNSETIPDKTEALLFAGNHTELKNIIEKKQEEELHKLIANELDAGRPAEAWKALVAYYL